MILRLPRFLVAIVFVAAGLVLTITGEWALVFAAWIEDVDIYSAFE